MIKNDVIRPINFQAQTTDTESKTAAYTPKIAAGAAAVLTAGAGVYALSKTGEKSFAQVLEKQGLVIRDGIAVLKETGEKFTGEIKRNVKILGLEKETAKYSEGLLTEKVSHDLFGRELKGEFYKNGVLRIQIPKIMSSGKKKIYPVYKFDKNGKLESLGDSFGTETNSVFENIRKHLENLQ